MKSLSSLAIIASIFAFTATTANAYDATSGRGDRAPQDTLTSQATPQAPIAAPPIQLPLGASTTSNENPQLYRVHINNH